MAKKRNPLPVQDDVVEIRSWLNTLLCLFCKTPIRVSSYGGEVRCENCIRWFVVHTRRDKAGGAVVYKGLVPKRHDECYMCKVGVILWDKDNPIGRCHHCKQEWKVLGINLCPVNIQPSPEIAELLERRKDME